MSFPETVEEGELPRYRLLEVVREFAVEKLAGTEEEDAIAERHSRYFQELAEKAAPKLNRAGAGLLGRASGPGSGKYSRRAGNAGIAGGRRAGSARLRPGSGASLDTQVYVQRGRPLAGAGRGRTRPRPMRRRTERGQAAAFRRATGVWEIILPRGRQRRKPPPISRADNNFVGLSEALTTLAHVTYYEGLFDDSLPIYESALEAARRGGELSGVASALGNLGVWHSRRGDGEKARAYLEEQIAIRRQQGDRHGVSMVPL